MAGVTQSHIYRRFVWQAYGTGWRPWAGICRLGAAPLCVAGVAQPDILAQSHIYRRFAWQAWHLWYWVAPLGRDVSPGR